MVPTKLYRPGGESPRTYRVSVGFQPLTPDPATKRDWLSVVNRSRARGIPLTRLLRGSQEKLTTKERRRIVSTCSKLATFLSQISDDELCAGDATKLATRLRADGEEDRARLGKRLDAKLVLAADLKTKGDVAADVAERYLGSADPRPQPPPEPSQGPPDCPVSTERTDPLHPASSRGLVSHPAELRTRASGRPSSRFHWSMPTPGGGW